MRVSRRTRITGALTSALAALLTAGCTVGPSERPAVLIQDTPGEDTASDEQGPAPLPPLGAPPPNAIGWRDWPECLPSVTDRLPPAARGLTVECSTVVGPSLDHRGPEHEVALMRVGKGDLGRRVPVVVVGDVDGPPGSELAAELAGRLPDRLLQQVALVGVDRRGTGRSNPIDCIPRYARHGLLGLDPDSSDPEPLVEAVRKSGQECSIALGNEQTVYDARHTAEDLEEVRRTVGVPKLHAIARGEGSRVLIAYANAHPQSVGRFVFDGTPDPATDATATLADLAAATEATLRAFGDDCASRSDCPLGSDPSSALAKAVDRARHDPAEVDGIQVGPAMVLYAAWLGLRDPDGWPHLARAIDDAADGSPARLVRLVRPVLEPSGEAPPTIDATLTTICNDTTTRLPTERIVQLAASWREKYPTFGGLIAQRLLWCSQWPVPTEKPPGLHTPGIPPTLLIATAADPVTPEKGTSRTADQLAGARKVSWEGAGHGAIGRSDCVTKNVTDFLLDGKVPNSNVVCPA